MFYENKYQELYTHLLTYRKLLVYLTATIFNLIYYIFTSNIEVIILTYLLTAIFLLKDNKEVQFEIFQIVLNSCIFLTYLTTPDNKTTIITNTIVILLYILFRMYMIHHLFNMYDAKLPLINNFINFNFNKGNTLINPNSNMIAATLSNNLNNTRNRTKSINIINTIDKKLDTNIISVTYASDLFIKISYLRNYEINSLYDFFYKKPKVYTEELKSPMFDNMDDPVIARLYELHQDLTILKAFFMHNKNSTVTALCISTYICSDSNEYNTFIYFLLDILIHERLYK